MRNWSDLKREEQLPWLTLSRQTVYEGLEPWSHEKEAATPGKARDLYYEHSGVLPQ